jgi:4-hydroxy-tetrahydrodipicolinate reductase
MTALRVAIVGPGRMGAAVAELARSSGAEVVANIGADSAIDRDSLRGAEVAIEFTEPSAAPANILACVRAGCPVVCGTTGWYGELDAVGTLVRENRGALLWSSNFSLGVHALNSLLAQAGRIFATLPGFEAALVETHHSAKKDAPSGTARMLQKTFSEGWGSDVPVTSVRVGSVPGTHTLIIDGAFEQIVVSHEARDRRVFAEGALVAAGWLVGRQGVFTLDDVLSAKEDQ